MRGSVTLNYFWFHWCVTVVTVTEDPVLQFAETNSCSPNIYFNYLIQWIHPMFGNRSEFPFLTSRPDTEYTSSHWMCWLGVADWLIRSWSHRKHFQESVYIFSFSSFSTELAVFLFSIKFYFFCEYFVVSLMKVWLVPALERAVPG